MQIVCPHCTTSYAVDPATLGAAGRTVRCSRCKEVWLARPEDGAAARVMHPALAEAGGARSAKADVAAEWEALAREESDGAPIVDSPSIADEGPTSTDLANFQPANGTNWTYEDGQDSRTAPLANPYRTPSWLRRVPTRLTLPAAFARTLINLPVACAAMGALALALTIWRSDVVRLLPQTAAFYRLVGLDVNVRGLLFKDVKITSETVEGKPVLVIEGVITSESRKAVELPRLRFGIRDSQGAEIYAWNTVLAQPLLKPGERAWFKSRLASPPPEGRNIDIRFFNRRDIAGGNA